MALLQNDRAVLMTPPTPPAAGLMIAAMFDYVFAAGKVPANGDIIEIGVLPAYAQPVDWYIDSDDLDSNGTPTLAYDVGIMSGEVGELLNPDGSARTCGAEFFAATVASQAAGTTARPAAKSPKAITPVATKDRSIGVKLTAAAATFAAAGGTLRFVVYYREGILA